MAAVIVPTHLENSIDLFIKPGHDFFGDPKLLNGSNQRTMQSHLLFVFAMVNSCK
jgi:hypothetical protein